MCGIGRGSSLGEFGFRGEVIVLSSGQLVNLHNIRQDAANWFLLFGFLLFFFNQGVGLQSVWEAVP